MNTKLRNFATNRHSVEVLPPESITKTCEKLDLHVLLQRAQLGIVDLNDFSTGRLVYDGTAEEAEKMPNSVLHRPFGVSREEAREEMEQHLGVARGEVEKSRKKAASQASAAQEQQNAAQENEHASVPGS